MHTAQTFSANKRIFMVSCLAALLILAVGALKWRYGVEHGVDKNMFWSGKIFWNKQFDVVMAGDSRTYRGLSPAIFQQILGAHQRIGNFGFSSCGFGAQYLSQVGNLFDPASHQKKLILGITPGALTVGNATVNNGYLNLVRQDVKDLVIMHQFGPLLSFFDPLGPTDISSILHHGKTGYFQQYHPDGWIASAKIPEHPDEALGPYIATWQQQKVSPQVVASLLDRVSGWTKQGVQVFAFSPPTSAALHEIERRMSGFDPEDFKKRFEQAGGIWLDIQPGKYHSYDGSHLREDGARRLSTDLAQAIRQHESLAYQKD